MDVINIFSNDDESRLVYSSDVITNEHNDQVYAETGVRIIDFIIGVKGNTDLDQDSAGSLSGDTGFIGSQVYAEGDAILALEGFEDMVVDHVLYEEGSNGVDLKIYFRWR